MNDFKNAYQSAVQDMNMLGMKEIHIDASACMDDRRHKRHMMKRVQRVTATTFSAMCVVFICGFGSVKAAEYIGNVIRVNEWGFESGDAVTMARNEAEGGQTYVIGDEVRLEPSKKESASNEEMISEEPVLKEEVIFGEESISGDELTSKEESVTEDTRSIDSEDTSDILQASAAAEEYDESTMLASVEAEALQDGQKKVMQDKQSGIEQLEVEEIPVKDYSSWEEFEQNEDIIFPQPSINVGTNIENTNITVCGDWVMARYDVDDKILWIERTDYSGTQGHAASKVFPGGVCNERTYTTSQGYTYTLVDSVKESDGQRQIHAAITVGSYEAFIDFMGYTEEEAEKIMDSIDLSLYE